jgi:hypothetical protein
MPDEDLSHTAPAVTGHFIGQGLRDAPNLGTCTDLRHVRKGFPIRDSRLNRVGRPRKDAITVDLARCLSTSINPERLAHMCR